MRMTNEELLAMDEANRERLSKRDFNTNFLVSAGAGAGKTYLTVNRAFNMLCDKTLNVSPQEIVMITFTRKAATEMKVRLNGWIRKALNETADPQQAAFLQHLLESLPEMQISTIHSFCRKVLCEYPLESGIGFAPQFDPEDEGPESRAGIFFNNAWKSGRFPESMKLGVPQKVAENAFCTLTRKPEVQVQYVDMTNPAGHEIAENTLKECERIVRIFRESINGADPSVFHYLIGNAIQLGDRVAENDLIDAAKYVASKLSGARNWMGKTASKKAATACSDLGAFLSEPDEESAMQVLERAFEDAKSTKGAKRDEIIPKYVPELPREYQIVIELLDLLPSDEELANLEANIQLLLHGILTGEVLQLSKEYNEYRRRNHIVTTDDMLYLTADLVRNYPAVRAKLHNKYRTFFVDEYQDTDPIQTDIIFGIAADHYDPDWHKCVPKPGSLFLVGDAKQGIYRFRGADISLWHEAEEVIRATGGEVVPLFKNFRSTPEICQAVTGVFGTGGPLCMEKSPYQAEYSEMVADRKSGPVPVLNHTVSCANSEDGHGLAARQIAQMIRDRVDSGQNKYEDFLLLSFYREKRHVYASALREKGIPVKFDGSLDSAAYPPLQLLNLRVQAVCHPLDEALSFRVLSKCGGISPEEWDLFRMNVGQLPEDTKLAKYTNIRSLMGHVDRLSELLPDTEMNRKVMTALSLMDRDRKLSQQRTPCAFLEEIVERSDGLFTEDYPPEEFQNQYAALLQIIDSIRALNPQHFSDMADQLNVFAESEMDRMPSVRADSNFVRLMNLHKAKGLQGKIVIFLPRKVSTFPADCNLVRQGNNVLGWFQLKEKGYTSYVKYDPPEWETHKKEEDEFLKAEKIRLRYVALTRVEDEAHIFTISVEAEGKKPQLHMAWDGFDTVGMQAPDIEVREDEEGTAEPADPDAVVAEVKELEEKEERILQKAVRRTSPSTLDVAGNAEAGELGVQKQNEHDGRAELFTKPGGTEWGTAVHQTAELVVLDNRFSEESIVEAARQVVEDRFPTELMTEKQRQALRIPKAATTLKQIHEYLENEICKALQFMTDPDSSFRKTIRGGVCYPEMPFTISISPENGQLYDDLKILTGSDGERRLEISGTMDLAVRYPDGTWKVLDYKTDRMLPSDGGSMETFRARLNSEYAAQLKAYKVILEYLTGESVTETVLISV